MEKFTLNLLLTPDPHHIPGFMGHCPQLIYKCGRSYAQLTSEILSRSHVNRSRVQVPTAQSDTAVHLRMIPGYTGFVPRSQNRFGASYMKICREAISEFNQERQATIHHRYADLPAVVNDLNKQPERPKPPLTLVSNKAFLYKPMKPFVPLVTPYMMDDKDPHKHFITGFAGHVPKSRFLCGKSFPDITNQALIEFGEQQRAEYRKGGPVTSTSTVSHEGVVPFFAGHIPGYRFMFGQSFGQLAKDALEKNRIRRKNQDKL